MQELSSRNQGKNIFISPISIQLALSMLYNGAEGQTRLQMSNLLTAKQLPLNFFNQQNSQLIKSLTADPAVQLDIANSLWIRQGTPIKPEFLERNRQFYSALVSVSNFADPRLVGTINDWVKKQTKGKITQIVDRINPQTVMFLINAIYFRGNWRKSFDPKLTKPQPFRLSNGKTKTVPMMNRSDSFSYLENDRFQAVQLPYGTGRFRMVILLPKPNQSPATLLNSLTTADWNTWMTSFQTTDGSLSLPRFRMEYEINLPSTLQKLGMTDAFSPSRANLQGISTLPLVVSQIKHKSVIEVNEKGTTAAGTTSIEVEVTSAPLPPSNPFTMIVDRPFIIAIRDSQTDSLLFMGAIYEP
jgi:serpin B